MTSSGASKPDSQKPGSSTPPKPIITLTTDFGYSDSFVGEMKGVLLSINPAAPIIDVTHGIEKHDIRAAAFIIHSAYRYFPKGSIHVAVIDPGVGSQRKGIILAANGHYFVGPDNGLFSYIFATAAQTKVVQITDERYLLVKESATFQGRDLFAPAAAWLSRGIELQEFGPEIKNLMTFKVPLPVIENETIIGEVIYIDKFGNAITNIRKSHMEKLPAKIAAQFSVAAGQKKVNMVTHYAEARGNELSCLINSSGYLELFANKKSAAELFQIDLGEKVTVSCLRF